MAGAGLAALVILLGLWIHTPPAATAVKSADPDPAALRPARQGAWVDEIVFSKQAAATEAISRLRADELDIYPYTVAGAGLYQWVLEDPELALTESFGSYNELTFNPSGPTFNDGRLNPFSNPKIREAMNWLIDRDHIAQGIFGGMAIPKWVSLVHGFPDYVRHQSTIQGLEAEYAYDLTRAQQAITTEMLAMGATLQGGTWHYNG